MSIIDEKLGHPQPSPEFSSVQNDPSKQSEVEPIKNTSMDRE